MISQQDTIIYFFAYNWIEDFDEVMSSNKVDFIKSFSALETAIQYIVSPLLIKIFHAVFAWLYRKKIMTKSLLLSPL
jgi:hypothetical protein